MRVALEALEASLSAKRDMLGKAKVGGGARMHAQKTKASRETVAALSLFASASNASVLLDVLRLKFRIMCLLICSTCAQNAVALC